jgi:hypothetical protein
MKRTMRRKIIRNRERREKLGIKRRERKRKSKWNRVPSARPSKQQYFGE